ncbi:MAG: ankyrin repeat domain-containing protein [Coxiellaceae bacterium]|nr:ankyrin repeat domain-containing protein [Coxiellaceae bacterium]
MRCLGASAEAGGVALVKKRLGLFCDPLTVVAEYLSVTDRSGLFCSIELARELTGPVNVTTLRKVFPELSAELEKQHKGEADYRWVIGELRTLYQKYYAIHPGDEPSEQRRKNLLWYARTGNWGKFFSASPTLIELMATCDKGMPKQEYLMGLILSKRGRSWLDSIYQKLAIPKFKTSADDDFLDVSRVDDDEAQLLHWAVACNQIERVINLVAVGVAVNQAITGGATALVVAALYGHNEVVKSLLAAAGTEVNKAMPDGATALYMAAQNGHSEVVKSLLAAAGIAINQAGPDGTSALYIAAQKGHSEVVKILLVALGIAVNQAKTNGATALYMAAQNGHSEVVKSLLAAPGIAVNQAKTNGATALYIAAQFGHLDVVKALLLAEGIQVNKTMQDGATALYIAAQFGHLDVVKALLLAEGIQVNKTMQDGATALYIAAQKGHSEVVKSLLAAPGIAINQARLDGTTALYIAAQKGHSEVVKSLLAAPGIAINQVITDGVTAPFIAAQNGHSEVVAILPFNDIPLQRTALALKTFVSNKGVEIKARMRAHIGDVADDATVEITAIEIAGIMGHDDIVCELEAKRMSQSLGCYPTI